ncbi:AzlC family ABC transporter permease [Alkalihalobacillus pseudalcaliphilus]|uniref:AzlC family ABC transporter permease n=1 Tax=Alkalihalobacillus pseudalcaliphilus TaxID=79884 RepID=UPI00064DE6F9|nr:AzlC family ABC transporter permease [Alkalihalobacillus pseudalcaliphilus]KMK74758.1 branched-chain amino acid ABC transporter permease [Alkalihalobacillus pseudalcaliphilus]
MKKESLASDFLYGVQYGTTIAFGYIPAALAFGLLAKATGITWLETLMMSMFVFAGAAQYMSLNLIALGTGGFEIIFTTFIVNIRHLLLSASLSEKAAKDNRFIKAIYSFFITDEAFAVITTKKGTPSSSFILGVGLIGYLSWVSMSLFGFVIGQGLPVLLQESMGIALYALFIALLVPNMKRNGKVISLAVSAALLNGLLSQFLADGWAIVSATLLASIGVEIIFRRKESFT